MQNKGRVVENYIRQSEFNFSTEPFYATTFELGRFGADLFGLVEDQFVHLWFWIVLIVDWCLSSLLLVCLFKI